MTFNFPIYTKISTNQTDIITHPVLNLIAEVTESAQAASTDIIAKTSLHTRNKILCSYISHLPITHCFTSSIKIKFSIKTAFETHVTVKVIFYSATQTL